MSCNKNFVIYKYKNPNILVNSTNPNLDNDYFCYLFYYNRTIKLNGIAVDRYCVGISGNIINEIFRTTSYNNDKYYMIKLIFTDSQITPLTGLSRDDIGINKFTDNPDILSKYDNIVLTTRNKNHAMYLINDLQYFVKSTSGFTNYSIQNLKLCIYYTIYFKNFCTQPEIDIIKSNYEEFYPKIGSPLAYKELIEEPADTEPADTEPADTEPADTEPADTEPADTEPADTEPADTEPVETQTVADDENADAYENAMDMLDAVTEFNDDDDEHNARQNAMDMLDAVSLPQSRTSKPKPELNRKRSSDDNDDQQSKTKRTRFFK